MRDSDFSDAFDRWVVSCPGKKPLHRLRHKFHITKVDFAPGKITCPICLRTFTRAQALRLVKTRDRSLDHRPHQYSFL